MILSEALRHWIHDNNIKNWVFIYYEGATALLRHISWKYSVPTPEHIFWINDNHNYVHVYPLNIYLNAGDPEFFNKILMSMDKIQEIIDIQAVR
jgi:hypothetical protein